VVTNQTEFNGGDIQMISTAEKLQSDAAGNPSSAAWFIWVKTIASEDDLRDMIEAWFGEYHDFGTGCAYGGLNESKKKDVYNVSVVPVRPGNGSLGTSSCDANWMVAFKYSPKHHRAAVWDIGQESQFYICEEVTGCDADSKMADSFYFIDRI
jgi:hypothetical protein